jgi:hypothetical protein
MMCCHQRREQDVSYWRTLKEILTCFLRSPLLLGKRCFRMFGLSEYGDNFHDQIEFCANIMKDREVLVMAKEALQRIA